MNVTISSTSESKPQLNVAPMPLFPTLDSLEAVIELGLSQLPINTPNALVCLLMTYHNSLLKQISQ